MNPGEHSEEARRFEHEIDRLRQGRPSRRRHQILTLGSYLPHQFKREHEQPFRKMGQLAEHWQRLVPSALLPVTALVSFQRGVLTVQVPDSSVAWNLERSLAEGLLEVTY